MIEHGWRKRFSIGAIATFLLAFCDQTQCAVPNARREDASLHAVHFLDRSLGWAVGDRGAAVRTSDGGETWELRPVTEDVSLRAVFFLNDRLGWAAGGTTTPFTET